MAIRTPDKKTKQQKKLLETVRRKERAEVERNAQQYREKQAVGMRAWQSEAQKLDPETLRRLAAERYGDNLLAQIRQRLHAAVRVDNQLRPHNPPVDLRQGQVTETGMGVFAYTDFRTITIKVDGERIPPVADTNGTRDFVFAVKGLFHHEAGHIIHSWPLWDMWREADQSFKDRCAQNDVHGYEPMQHAWNIIEDQRMESARVRDFPAVQGYFEHTMGTFLLNNRDEQWWEFSAWALLAGREYLNPDIRKVAELKFKADAAEWLRLVREYKAATTHDELLDALLDAYLFLKDNQQEQSGGEGLDQHDGNGQATNGAGKAAASATKPGDGSEGAGKGDKPEKGEGEGDGEGDPSDEKSDSKPDSDPDFIDAGLGEGGEHFTDKQLEDAIRQLTTKKLSQDEQQMVRDAVDASQAVGLPEYTGQVEEMDGAAVSQALSLQHGIVRALETYVTRATPHWVLNSEEGYLDPCAYRTRDVGELNYHVGMEGDQGQVLDLHVSVLADVSYSMASHMKQLSVMMLGMKLAVDELGIPANFTLWSSGDENYRIFGDGPDEVIYPALGGTDPTDALDDAVLANEEERPNHLFLVFTDGEWYGVNSVAKWRKGPEQQFVIVKFGQGPRQIHGADAIIDLPSLSAFPDTLRDALDNMLDGIV
jgi:hypothetical protein